MDDEKRQVKRFIFWVVVFPLVFLLCIIYAFAKLSAYLNAK
jgi:cbb3-type cytochrome oxidase subunit 3